jgi:hypothetical protein
LQGKTAIDIHRQDGWLDHASNPNGNLLLELIWSAFADENEEQYQCFLNAMFGKTSRNSSTFKFLASNPIFVNHLIALRELYRIPEEMSM